MNSFLLGIIIWLSTYQLNPTFFGLTLCGGLTILFTLLYIRAQRRLTKIE